MKLLIIGGAGFMGSNLVHHFIEKGDHEVVVLDKLTYAGRLENLREVRDRIVFVRGDLANEELLEHIIEEHMPEHVVNLAAETHVDRSINQPAPFLETNVKGLFTLLEVARRRDLPLTHVSTDEVYGDLSHTREKATEDWPLNPSSPYSATKAAGDLLIKAYARTYGLEYRIIRPSNNYGPRQHPEKLIPRTIIRLHRGLKATLYGDGSQERDWLYVGDFTRAVEKLLESNVKNTIINICTGKTTSVAQIVESITRLMGKDPHEAVARVGGRPGEDRRYAMDCTRARELLGWKPETSLDQGLKKTIDWYLENKWWWEPLVERDRNYILAEEPWKTQA